MKLTNLNQIIINLYNFIYIGEHEARPLRKISISRLNVTGAREAQLHN